MSATALPTYYRGITFRSRLEARWALVFDRLRIVWEYEPEGFVGWNGERYLPDFRLPHVRSPYGGWSSHGYDEGIFVEIKGSGHQLEADRIKISGAIDYDATPVSAGLLLLGRIPRRGEQALHTFLYWEKGVRAGLTEFVTHANEGPIAARNQPDEWWVGDALGDELTIVLEPHLWTYDDLLHPRLRFFPAPMPRVGEAHDAALNARFGT